MNIARFLKIAFPKKTPLVAASVVDTERRR